MLFSTLCARVLKYIIALILYLSRGKCNVGCIFVDKGKGGKCRPQVVEKVHFYKTQQILYPYPPAPFPGKGGEYGDCRPCDLPWGYAQSKDALVACQKFCTMQNQQSKQR